MAIAAGIALIPVAGCASDDEKEAAANVPAASDPPSDTGSTPAPSANAADISKCADVEPAPRRREYDSVLDAESGILRIYFGIDGVNQEYAIAYKTDPTCQDDPGHREIIEHVLEDAPR